MRGPRNVPTATELCRIEKILEVQPAFHAHLGLKVAVEKRTGERVSVSQGTIAVARELMARSLNPERAHVGKVLRVAGEVFGIL